MHSMVMLGSDGYSNWWGWQCRTSVRRMVVLSSPPTLFHGIHCDGFVNIYFGFWEKPQVSMYLELTAVDFVRLIREII